MAKLKRLKINRYRNVKPCDLVFSNRFNIVLGPNGSGKTTLLELISKVLRTNLGDTSDPFSIEVELAFDGGTLSGTIETSDEPRTALPREIQGRSGMGRGVPQVPRAPNFQLKVARDTPPSIVSITREDHAIFVKSEATNEQKEWALETIEEHGSSLIGTSVLIASMTTGTDDLSAHRQLQCAARFDESLDAFRSITGRQDDAWNVSPGFRPLVHCIRLNATQKRVIAILGEGIAPPAILKQIEARFREGATDISFNENELPFLLATVAATGMRSSTARMELIAENASASISAELGNLKFWFTRKDGSVFQDQHLSYGQKRLLTFLYYLEANPSFVIADELVNGLHHAWIDECMKAIGERQAFLTSQNPLLLDYLSFESVEEVKTTFILCSTEADGDRERMIWRNMNDVEAEMFYSAYKVGIEHVGEILRTRGLW